MLKFYRDIRLPFARPYQFHESASAPWSRSGKSLLVRVGSIPSEGRACFHRMWFFCKVCLEKILSILPSTISCALHWGRILGRSTLHQLHSTDGEKSSSVRAISALSLSERQLIISTLCSCTMKSCFLNPETHLEYNPTFLKSHKSKFSGRGKPFLLPHFPVWTISVALEYEWRTELLLHWVGRGPLPPVPQVLWKRVLQRSKSLYRWPGRKYSYMDGNGAKCFTSMDQLKYSLHQRIF